MLKQHGARVLDHVSHQSVHAQRHLVERHDLLTPNVDLGFSHNQFDDPRICNFLKLSHMLPFWLICANWTPKSSKGLGVSIALISPKRLIKSNNRCTPASFVDACTPGLVCSQLFPCMSLIDDTDLQFLVRSWKHLPEPVRETIHLIVRLRSKQ